MAITQARKVKLPKGTKGSRKTASLVDRMSGKFSSGSTLTPREAAVIALGGKMFAGGEQKKHADEDKSTFDRLKDFGGAALDTLSVPGAVVMTGLTNAIRGAKGQDLVSWKNLAGTFRDEKYAGGAALLETLGVDGDTARKWGGLGLDSVLDPTWLVGAGALNAGSKLGTKAAKAGASARFAQNVEIGRFGKAAEHLWPKIGTDDDVIPKLMELRTAAGFAEAQKKAIGVVPALRLGFGRKTVDGVKVRRGVQIPLAHKPLFARDIKKVAPGRFNLPAMGEVLAHSQDVARSEGKAATALIDHDLKDIPEIAFARVGSLMPAFTDRRALKAAIKERRAAGTWGADENRALRYVIRLGKRQGKQLGYKSFAEQRAMMSKFRKQQDARVGETAAKLATKADPAVLESALERASLSIFAQRNKRLQQLDEMEQATRSKHREAVRTADTSAASATANLSSLQQRLANIEAQLAAKHNDVEYVTGLAQPMTGRRIGQNKVSVRLAAEKRVKQLNAAKKLVKGQIKEATKAQRSALDSLAQARKALDTDVGELQKARDELVAQYDKINNTAAKRLSKGFEKRAKAAEAQLAHADAEAVGEAHAYALTNKLTEFHPKTASYAPNARGQLEPGHENQALHTLEAIDAKIDAAGGWVAYFHHAPDKEMLREIDQWLAEQYKKGYRLSNVTGSSEYVATTLMKKRQASNPYEIITKEQSVKSMVAAGLPEDEAVATTELLSNFFKFADKPKAYDKVDMPDIFWKPDFNALSVIKTRETAQYHALLERQFQTLVKEHFPGTDATKMWEDLTTQYRTARISGSPATLFGLAKRKLADGTKVDTTIPRTVLATAWLKAWFTVMNLGHYVMNAIGSYINDLIEGNWRHLARGFGPNLPGHQARKLGRLEEHPVMDKVFKLGDSELTGRQLATAARLSGLGLGYTQAEIEMVAHIFEGTGRVKGVARLMTKLNMDRENADRVWSWMNHVKAGNDPYTAAAKVLRTKFDYNAATAFEKIWMRNLMLFYTWYKNNMILQGYGLLAKPGIYSTLNHVENSRPKLPGEPEWWKKAGGLYSPFGLITFGNPLADVYKFNLSQDNLRQNILGVTTPLVQSPISLLTGRDMFTGGDLSKFADQNVPSPLGSVLNPLGIGTPSRAQADGELSPAVPWYIAKLARDFSGPYGSSIGAVTSRPDQGYSKWYNVLPRFTGARLNPEDRKAWDKSLKARQTKKKADATRKANYEKQP